MPNRMLRDWTDSVLVSKISIGAERFFTRLIMKADDFGRFHADPCLLRSILYPRIIEQVKEKDISKFIDECEKNDLITVYQVGSKYYLEIKEFGQRLRSMKGKFPGPPVKNDSHSADRCPPTAADGGQSQTIVGSEEKIEEKIEVEEKEEGAGARLLIPEEFLGIVVYDAEKALLESQIVFEAICMKTGHDPTAAKDTLRKYHLYLQEKEQYPKGKKAVIAGFEKWLMNEKKFTSNGTGKRSTPIGGYSGRGPTNGINANAIVDTGVGDDL